MSISSSARDGVTESINQIGESVTVYNATQTTDSDTAYESLTDDDFLDGSNAGTSETASIQPISRSRVQMSEGRLIEGDVEGFFKHDSVITENSLVKVISTNYLYKVKEIETIRVSSFIYHHEVILEFVRDLSE